MRVIIYDKNTKKGEFTNWGYGKLRLVEKCEVTEELNGRYDTELIVNREDPKAHYLKKWAIVSVDGQLFRVVNKIDNDQDNTVKAFCKHIFYDINYGFIEDQRAENKNVLMAMQTARPDDFNYFDLSSDIEDLNTIYFVKDNGAQAMLSIIERWGQGEIIRDNFNIYINKNKGNDNGVTFTYKKLDAIEILEDTENVVTRLYPTGKDGITLSEKYIEIPNWNDDEYPPFHITKEISFEDAENEGDLRKMAQMATEEIGLAAFTFSIEVNDLADTSLYKAMPELMKVQTGDTVTIKHNRLNVKVKVKCVKRAKDHVTGKVKLEFGQPFKSLFDNINNSNVKVDMPNLGKYTNNLNYFENGLKMTVSDAMDPIGNVTVVTTEETSIMSFVSGCIHSVAAGLLEAEIHLKYLEEDRTLNFKPRMQLQPGYNMISFSIPLLFLDSHMAYDYWLHLKCTSYDEPTTVTIEPYQLNIVLQGQRLAEGVERPGKPEFEDKMDIEIKPKKEIKTIGGVEFLVPIVIKEEETQNIIIKPCVPIATHGKFVKIDPIVEECGNRVTIPIKPIPAGQRNSSVIIELGVKK